MKRMAWRVILFCLLACVFKVAADGIDLDPKDAAEVREKLEGYSKGKLTLEEVSDDEEWGKRIIAYYRTHTNEITVKMKLPIARCYAGFGGYSNAVVLISNYLNVYTNDARAWDMLALSKYMLRSYEDGFVAGTNALRLGCERNIAVTAGVALQIDRLDVLATMVPRLLVLKNAKETSQDDKRELVAALVLYSLSADKKDVFIKALQGVDPKMVLEDPKLKCNVKLCCDQFGQGTDEICNKILQSKDSEPGK